MQTDDTSKTLLATLKRHNPAKVRAYTSDDDARDIAVPTRRKRWSQVIEAIEARAWVRVELLDKGGAVLAYVENSDQAHDVEELGQSAAMVKGHAEHALAVRIVELVLKGQREAMAFRDSEVKELLGAHSNVLREMSQGMSQLANMYREQVEAAREVARLQTEASLSPEGFDIKSLLEAAPVIVQALPMLRGLLAQSSPSPSNGVKKT